MSTDTRANLPDRSEAGVTDQFESPDGQSPKQKEGPKRRGKKDYGAIVGATWLGLVILAAIFAPLLPLPDPTALGGFRAIPPFEEGAHILGTDALGRDTLARLVHGARVSMAVAVLGTLMAMIFGVAIGMIAGYFSGRTDGLLSFLINFLLSFPPLIFLIALVAALQPSITTLVLGLALLGIPNFARVARANTISFAKREFVTAAKALGATPLRILTRELLANVMVPVMSLALVVMATLVVAEGALSFLGLGVPPPSPTWGGMIAAGRESLSRTPHIALVPSVVFFLTVFAFNRLGDFARSRIGKESALG